MIKIGIGAALFFWVSLTLATHPLYLKSFIVDLAVVGPVIFLTIYLRTLGLLVTDLRRYLRIRLFVWQAKKNENQQQGMPSPS